MQQEGTSILSVSGRVYGRVAFTLTIAGMIISAAGLGMLLADVRGDGDIDAVLEALLSGRQAHDIRVVTDHPGTGGGYWYLGHLTTPPGLIMFGIALCCFAPVAGAWSSLIAMHLRREEHRCLVVLLGSICLILIVSALGLGTILL